MRTCGPVTRLQVASLNCKDVGYAEGPTRLYVYICRPAQILQPVVSDLWYWGCHAIGTAMSNMYVMEFYNTKCHLLRHTICGKKRLGFLHVIRRDLAVWGKIAKFSSTNIKALRFRPAGRPLEYIRCTCSNCKHTCISLILIQPLHVNWSHKSHTYS